MESGQADLRGLDINVIGGGIVLSAGYTLTVLVYTALFILYCQTEPNSMSAI